MTQFSLPKLEHFSISLPIEGAIRIELAEGIPIFWASSTVQSRIKALLENQQEDCLSAEEEVELNGYEEMGDYLSFVNRTVRNLLPHSLRRPTTLQQTLYIASSWVHEMLTRYPLWEHLH
jgi:hypothetical protein